jgi:hypothetical protein
MKFNHAWLLDEEFRELANKNWIPFDSQVGVSTMK